LPTTLTALAEVVFKLHTGKTFLNILLEGKIAEFHVEKVVQGDFKVDVAKNRYDILMSAFFAQFVDCADFIQNAKVLLFGDKSDKLPCKDLYVMSAGFSGMGCSHT
jgi:hypothetical protein